MFAFIFRIEFSINTIFVLSRKEKRKVTLQQKGIIHNKLILRKSETMNKKTYFITL